MQETQETPVQSLSGEDTLKKEMTAHSSILAWKILWTRELCGLQFMGSQRAGHNWATEKAQDITLYILAKYWKIIYHFRRLLANYFCSFSWDDFEASVFKLWSPFPYLLNLGYYCDLLGLLEYGGSDIIMLNPRLNSFTHFQSLFRLLDSCLHLESKSRLVYWRWDIKRYS